MAANPVNISEEVLRALNFELAYHRIIADSWDDFIIPFFGYKEYGRNLDSYVEKIKEEIVKGYNPTVCFQIDIPKKDYTIRKGSVPVFRDRLLFQGLVDQIAKDLDATISDNVFSSRVRGGNTKYIFKHAISQWFKYNDRKYEIFSSGLYPTGIDADLTSYFDHVILNRLKDVLLEKPIDPVFIEPLMGFFKFWAGEKGVGIPVGPDFFHVFANVYLDEFDRFIEREGYGDRYARYLDEFVLGVNNDLEYRVIMKKIDVFLKNMNLFLNPKKTQKRTAKEIVEDIVERDKTIAEFDYFLEPYDEEEKPIPDRKLREVFEKAVLRLPSDDRLFRALLNRLNKLPDNRNIKRFAVDVVIEWFLENPFSADTYCRYLKNFVTEVGVREYLFSFLSSTHNIYEWQEMWVLEVLNSLKGLSENEKRALRSIIKDSNKAHICRGKAMALLGINGDREERNLIFQVAENSDNLYIQQGCCLGLLGLNKIIRNWRYKRLISIDPLLALTINHLKQ